MEINAVVPPPPLSRQRALTSLGNLFLVIAFALPLQAEIFQAAYDMAKTPGPADAPNVIAFGATGGDGFGRVVRTGDLNGDGIDDLIIGAPSADTNSSSRMDSGEVYVWFGKGSLAGTKDAGGVTGSPADLTILGAAGGDQLTVGGAIAIGDVNGDGIADLILGAATADGVGSGRGEAGAAFVILGRGNFPAVLDLSIQGNGGADVTIYGATANDQLTSGGAIAIGDANGDGIADIVLGAVFADGPGEARFDSGEVYVVLGRASFPTTLDLAIQGSAGADVTIYGATSVDNLTSGGALALGDVNGDGIADLVIGAVGGDGPAEGRSFAGEAYVVLGRQTFPATVDLAVHGSNGADVTIYGATGSDQLTSGGAIMVQDVNGDGIADILLGAIGGDGPEDARDGAGEAYVIFGRHAPSFFPTTMDLGVQGNLGADVTIYGATATDNLTRDGALSAADVNGDGIADILVGAPLADGPAEGRSACGEAYIVFGRASLPLVLDLNSNTTNAHADVTLYGAGAGDNLTIGGALLAGDVNGDGIADLLLGARDGDGPAETRNAAGEAYIVFGRTIFPPTLDMSVQGNSGADVVVYGATNGDQLSSGGAIAFGDLNADGYADLVLGAAAADGPAEGRIGAGEAYVVFGVGTAITGPEIAVEQPVLTNLSDGGIRAFANALVGTSNTRIFTIRNVGTENLTGLSLTKDGAASDDFSLDATGMVTTLVPGGTTSFSVSFTPSAPGVRNAVVHLASNDANENPFEINLTGFGTLPELSLQQPAGTPLTSSESRDFGSVPLGGEASLSFTITNTGSADLTQLVLSKSGEQAADYTFSSPGSTSVAAGSSATFVVTFTPSALGVRDAIIRLTSNDPNNNPFDIRLSGNGIEPTPEITVSQPTSSPLLSGASRSFGSLALGAQASLTFTIKNTGTATLADIAIQKDGLCADDYSVSTPGSNALAPNGGATTFTVTFAPTALGDRNILLHIISNDADENPFNIQLTGIGTDPEIVVEQPVGTNVADGAERTFGVVQLGSQVSLAFTVKNTGITDLTDLSITKDGVNAADYAISGPGQSTVATGNSTTFTVTFKPGGVGTRNAVLHLANNDADESPFDISLTGICIAPEIVVETSANVSLQDGESEIQFGGVIIETLNSQTFTIRNAGTALLKDLAVTKTGTDRNDFNVSSLSPDSLAPGGSMTFTISFNPLVAGTKAAVLHIASNDADEGSFDLALSGVAYPKEPKVTNDAAAPLSRIAFLGSKVTLAPIITGIDPKTYQWSKGTTKITGAAGMGTSYSIASLKAGDAAIYTLSAVNNFGAAISPKAYIGVITRAPLAMSVNAGASLSLSCTVVLPPGIKPLYTWRRDNTTIEARTGITGLGTKALKIADIRPHEAGAYTCLVTMPTAEGPVQSTQGDTLVTVVQKPAVTPFTLPAASVGENIHFLIPAINNPTSFTVTGLPPGIVLNKTSGLLSGQPTAAKLKAGVAVPYEMKVTVSNSAGTSVAFPVDWTILPLMPGGIGTFDGLLARQASLNSDLGGSIRVVTTGTGSISGKLILGALNYPLAGVLTTPTGGGNPTARLIITRKTPLTNLVISVAINLDTGRLEGFINDIVAITAWHATDTPKKYEGSYTAALLPPAMVFSNPATYPQGDGFVTLSITSTGLATWAGKLADGTVLTGSVMVGREGRVPFNYMLYGNLGSVQGWSLVDSTTGNLDSIREWDWYKASQAGSRSYASGIPLHRVTLTGGKYLKPNTKQIVLGLPPPPANAKLVFEDGEPVATFQQIFNITTANAIEMPANSRSMKLSLAAATGLFTGSFTLTSSDLLNPSKPNAVIKRTANFTGVLVPRLGMGTGQFLLLEVPKTAGQTVNNTAILSGHVGLKAGTTTP